MELAGQCEFENNKAMYAGGAVHWNEIEPQIGSQTSFDSNDVNLIIVIISQRLIYMAQMSLVSLKS